MHAGSAPQRIGRADVPDQFAYVGSHAWSAGPTPPALPGPVASEPDAVPPDHGLGLHDDEDLVPIGPDSAPQHPETAVPLREARPFHRLMEGDELLPQGQVLEGQPAAGLECGAKRAEKRPDHGGMLTPTREKDQLRWGRMNKWKAQVPATSWSPPPRRRGTWGGPLPRLRRQVGRILRELCVQRGVELIEGKALADHVPSVSEHSAEGQRRTHDRLPERTERCADPPKS